MHAIYFCHTHPNPTMIHLPAPSLWPIYLLDEATSALDESASVKLEKAILAKKNTTVIMVTHHLREEIKQLANEVINLNEVKE